jgi:hypothetical protein
MDGSGLECVISLCAYHTRQKTIRTLALCVIDRSVSSRNSHSLPVFWIFATGGSSQSLLRAFQRSQAWGHLRKTWKAVSSSTPQIRHVGGVQIPRLNLLDCVAGAFRAIFQARVLTLGGALNITLSITKWVHITANNSTSCPWFHLDSKNWWLVLVWLAHTYTPNQRLYVWELFFTRQVAG